MPIHFEPRNSPQDRKPGKVRRNERRAAIARKHGFLIDVLTVHH